MVYSTFLKSDVCGDSVSKDYFIHLLTARPQVKMLNSKQ